MNKHEHKTCLHKNLKHCSKCDMIYCEDCDKEWGNQGWNPWIIAPYSFDDGGTRTFPYDIPCGAYYL